MLEKMRSLTLRPYYEAGVESVLSGEMQARYMYNPKHPNIPQYHPNYHIESVNLSSPFEDPNQTRRMIRGAFTLRVIGQQGVEMEELLALRDSADPVPDLVDLNRDPISFSALGLLGAVKDLKCLKMVAADKQIVTPSLDTVKLLKKHPRQPLTVLMLDKIPTLQKGQQAARIYYRPHNLREV